MTTKEQEIIFANKIKQNYCCDIIINDFEPYTLYNACNIGIILNIVNIRTSIQNMDDTEKRIIICKTKGGNQKCLFLTYRGLCKLITSSRKPICLEFAKKVGIELITKYFISIETDILACILKAFNRNIIKLQYPSNNYKIDLYFEEYKIAVECDELHHNNTTNIQNDIKRQEIIEENLGCKFIRFRPYEKDFDIFILLNKINDEINTSIKNKHEFERLKLENDNLKLQQQNQELQNRLALYHSL